MRWFAVIFSPGLFSAILLCVAISSCSKIVNEERDDCPCSVMMDLSDVGEEIGSINLWIVRSGSGEIVCSERVLPYNYSRIMEFPLRRDLYRWYLWGGAGRATELSIIEENPYIVLKKREGFSADSLWFGCGLIDARGEESEFLTSSLTKEFINCKFRLRGGLGPEENLSILCTGTTVGYSLDGIPVGGPSRTYVKGVKGEDGISEAEFRLLRQTTFRGLSLSLTVEGNEGDRKLAEVRLGEILQEAGYDMEGELRDIDFTLDAALGLFSIAVKGWNHTVDVQIEF